jgi:DNA adenine methylase
LGRPCEIEIMNSPLCYIGGKSQLVKRIIPMIPQHDTYCEVFAGAAWVFFSKEESKHETINDLDGDLVSFYRCLQNHFEEFLRQFKWCLSSREWWNDWNRQIAAGGLTDIQRAARYYYIQRHSFGGKVKGRTFGASVQHGPRINLIRMEEELSAVHLRLSRVSIENLPWNEFVPRYDRPDTFFYLDPPYFKLPFYKHNFEGLEPFEQLSKVLSNIKGKFILSINDTPEMRKVFEPFKLKPVIVRYSANNKAACKGNELLISNC